MIKITHLPMDIMKYGDPFGFRMLEGVKQHHNGVDLKSQTPSVGGDNVYNIADGKIVRIWKSSSYGNCIIIFHGSWCSLYAHLKAFNCKLGDILPSGALIGFIGKTGLSYGYHLHVEIRDCAYDDNFWVKDNAIPSKYKYCVDMLPYITEFLNRKEVPIMPVPVKSSEQLMGEKAIDNLFKAKILNNAELWKGKDLKNENMPMYLVFELLNRLNDKIK